MLYALDERPVGNLSTVREINFLRLNELWSFCFNVGKWTKINLLASSWKEQSDVNEKPLFRKEKVLYPQGFGCSFLLRFWFLCIHAWIVV